MSPAAPRIPAARHLALLAPILVVCALVYRRAVHTFFALDDITFLAQAIGIVPRPPLVRPISESLAFRLQHAAFGLDPFGWHVVSLALHLAVVIGVYTLAVRLTGRAGIAAAAALLFGCSSIAFTPVHWTAAIVMLLTAAFLIAATLAHLEAARSGGAWRWIAALLALGAMFSKETAVTWVLVVAFVEWRDRRLERSIRPLVPALVAGLIGVTALLASGQMGNLRSSAYAVSWSPVYLAENLSTYLRWSVALWNPIRDEIAAMQPGAWPVGVVFVLGLYLAIRARLIREAALLGIVWWLAMLAPVLPLAHHSYLYYLYVPWVGGAIAVAAIGQEVLRRIVPRHVGAVGLVLLAAYAGIEARNVSIRETATRDYLPVDRTMREAMLLSHALPGIRKAALPESTGVLFVNPVPGRRLDLMTGEPTRPEDIAERASYIPLEAAMHDGLALRLFDPRLRYLGFTDTIPRAHESAECFYYEQRGWLEPWGHGAPALVRQGQVQLAAKRWSAAERSFARARALGDTSAAAARGEAEARAALSGGE